MIANSTTKKAWSRCLLFCAILMSVGGAQDVMASHFAGVDLYVRYVGTGPTDRKYAVVLEVTKICEVDNFGFPNASLSLNENYTYASVLAGVTVYKPISGKNWDTSSGYCGLQNPQNSCFVPGSPLIGYIKRRYVDTVTLPSAQTDWSFSWTSCCRNGAIANLQSPANQSIYVEARLNNTGTHWSNSTPYYDPTTAPLIPYLCNNQDDIYQTAPVDPDNDSLRTFNLNPLGTGPNNQLAYSALPYSLSNPIGSSTNFGTLSTPYDVNVATGTARFHPINTGKYVIAFRTYQYDKYTGEALGYISRDVQVVVASCTNNQPIIDTIPQNVVGGNLIQTPSGPQITVCPGVPMSFQIVGHSQNSIAYLVMSSNNANSAPGSVFTVAGAGTSNITGTLTWTPTTADVGQHAVVIGVADSTCNVGNQLVIRNSTIVYINVLPSIDAGPDGHYCNDEGPYNQPWQLNVVGPPGIGYTWSAISGNTTPPYGLSCINCDNPLASPTATTTYVVSTNAPQATCKNKDTVTVVVGPEPGNSIDAIAALPLVNGAYILCRPGYVNLDAITTGSPPPVVLPCGTSYAINCTNPDSAIVGTNPTTPVVGANTPYYSSSRYQKYQFIIPKAELIASGILSGTLKSLSFFSSSATPLGPNALANFTISLKCTNRTAFPAAATNADFEQGLTQVYTTATFINTASAWDKFVFQTPYHWDTSQNLVVQICMGQIQPSFNTSGTTPVNMVNGTAIQQYNNTTNVCATPTGSVYAYGQRPQVKFDYCQTPPPQFAFTWTPGQNVSDSSIKSPIAYIPHSTSYTVATLSRNGCVMRDSLQIIVPIHHLDIYPKDTAICVGQSVRLFATGGTSYQWFEDGFTTPATLSTSTGPTTTATPTDTGDITYTVVFTDEVSCNDTMSVTIHAWPLPNVHITTPDTTIKFGQHVNLMVTDANTGHGAAFYTWTPVGSLSDPNIPNPVASPTQNTTYILFGDDTHHCRSMDTININIDYRDHLMVPSAFTPNGDNKNDRFRVANLTFQKIMEFRVFNRWGQEVFSAKDNDGWDGMWKGVPQDLGSYQFIIRVGFPDGFVETYKGDVTLVR